MSRAWPVALLAVAFGASGSAFADKPVAPLACTCNDRYIVPEHELPVPQNAKVWVFGGTAMTATLSIDGTTIDVRGQRDGNTMRFEPGLAANQRYAFATDMMKTNLVIGAEVDDVPPQQPEARGIYITWHTTSSDVAVRTGDVDILATFSDDTALVRVTFVDRFGRRSVIYTTPHRLHLCNAIPEVHELSAVWLTALDIAGNASKSIEVTSTTSKAAATTDPCADTYGANFGVTPVENYFLAIAVMLGGGLTVGLVLMWLVRRTRYDAHAPPDPVSLLVAEQLVNGARRLHGLICAGAFVAMITGITAGAQWLTVLVILIGWHVDGWLKARRAAKLMTNPAAGAELRGSRLTIVAHGSHASILVSRRAVRAAKQRAVPEASAL